jgi:hypothetical protein
MVKDQISSSSPVSTKNFENNGSGASGASDRPAPGVKLDQSDLLADDPCVAPGAKRKHDQSDLLADDPCVAPGAKRKHDQSDLLADDKDSRCAWEDCDGTVDGGSNFRDEVFAAASYYNDSRLSENSRLCHKCGKPQPTFYNTVAELATQEAVELE